MKKPMLKICGFCDFDNIKLAINENIDYYGLVLVPKSKRFFGDNIEYLNKCCNFIKKNNKKAVGVFDITLDINKIREIIVSVHNLEIIQLYGSNKIGYNKCIEIIEQFSQNRKYIYCTNWIDLEKDIKYLQNDKIFSAISIDNRYSGNHGIIDSWLSKIKNAGGININNGSFADVIDIIRS